MKRIFVCLSIVGIVLSTQSCKVIRPKLCKFCDTKKTEVDSVILVTDTLVAVDNLTHYVTTEIVPFYNDNFDTLVKTTSMEQLQRDKSILQTATCYDSILNIKISELEEYHKAKSLLSKKYDSLVIVETIKSLKNKQFDGTETDRMISLLENYGYIIKNLRSLIIDINQRVKVAFDAGVENQIHYAKINDEVFTYLNEYVYRFLYPDDNNNANMSNYPHVLDICNRIMKIKREYLDWDILYLLNEI